jgi:UDP-N-acetylmuramate: L-alanyl-gamma-D-glutamyl-meso-diaminopimelate ligase
MRMGIHKANLPLAFKEADVVYAFIDNDWNWQLPSEEFSQPVVVEHSYPDLLRRLTADLQPGDTVVIMSNGSFGGIHQQLFKALQET